MRKPAIYTFYIENEDHHTVTINSMKYKTADEFLAARDTDIDVQFITTIFNIPR